VSHTGDALFAWLQQLTSGVAEMLREALR
jgi:hypothetical protein